jgi:hypothetical protein
MKIKDVCSLVTILTLSTGVATQSPVKADSILCRPQEIGCEQAISGVPRQNFSKLVKGSGSEVFLIQDGIRRWITDSTTFDYYGFKYSDVKQIFDNELNTYFSGKPISNNGTLLKGSGPEIYIMIGGRRRLVSASVFDKYHFRSGNVNLVTDSNLLSIPEGPAFR